MCNVQVSVTPKSAPAHPQARTGATGERGRSRGRQFSVFKLGLFEGVGGGKELCSTEWARASV